MTTPNLTTLITCVATYQSHFGTDAKEVLLSGDETIFGSLERAALKALKRQHRVSGVTLKSIQLPW